MPISLETRSLTSDLERLLNAESALDAMVQRARLAEPLSDVGFESFLNDANAHFKSSLAESAGHLPLGAGALVSGLLREVRRLQDAGRLLGQGLESARWPKDLTTRAEEALAALEGEGVLE